MILQRTRKYFSIFPTETPYLLISQLSVLPLEIRQREEEGRMDEEEKGGMEGGKKRKERVLGGEK